MAQSQPKTQKTQRKLAKKGSTSQSDRAQAKRFRDAAREAGVDPNADIDEVMRKLAAQKKPDRCKK
jgi:hypothetical protein